MSKLCKHCKVTKELDQFPIRKNTKSGLAGKCKECTKNYYKEYRKTTVNKKAGKLTNYLCYKLENIRKQDKQKFPEHEFNLVVEDLVEIYNKHSGKCVYSNKRLKPNAGANIYNKISFDRIDNNLPHIKENLQLTSQFMNMFRGDKTHEEFMNTINNY